MKVAVYGRPIHIEGYEQFFRQFTDCLKKYDIEFCLLKDYARFVKQFYKIETTHCDEEELYSSEFDFLISLGGDGTVLDTLSIVKDSGLAVVGVNLGRFGFLANIKVEEIEHAVQLLLNGKYSIEGRSVIQIDTDIEAIQQFPFALNDFVVQKRDSSAMISVDAYLDGEFLNSYWSDGLIVATPTGSTGYSLSCGGPLLFPGAKTFVLTPIAAHNLTVRPAVLPDDHQFKFEVTSRANSVLVSLDSRSYKVPSKTKMEIKKADFLFNMVQLEGVNYMDTIRTKLMWGLDSRNKA